MKGIFVGDAYITTEMMQAAAKQKLSETDTAEFFFFGEKNRGDMRDTVKMIEAHRREEIAVPEGLMEAVADAELLVVHLCPVNADLLMKAKKLKAVLSCRGGTENIDLAFAAEKGIVLAASRIAKLKTNVQMFWVIWLMACPAAGFKGPVAAVLMAGAVILTVVSLIDYAVKNKDIFREQQ